MALVLGLLAGILALAARVIALVSSWAAESRRVVKARGWLFKSLKPRSFPVASSRYSGELSIVLVAIFDLREAANRSQLASAVLYLAGCIGFLTRSGPRVPATEKRIPW